MTERINIGPMSTPELFILLRQILDEIEAREMQTAGELEGEIKLPFDFD